MQLNNLLFSIKENLIGKEKQTVKEGKLLKESKLQKESKVEEMQQKASKGTLDYFQNSTHKISSGVGLGEILNLYDSNVELKALIKKGDLIYGCSALETIEILNSIEPDSKKWQIVDNLNKEALGLITQKVVEDDWDGKYLMDVLEPYKGIKSAKTPEAVSHFEYLENHSKYDPRIIPQATNWQVNTRIKRACKGGIENILSNSNGNKVHFLLVKEFDPLMALNKNKTNEVKFTNIEFRFIYRQWKINSSNVDQKIIFWENGKSITPTDYFNSLGRHTYKPQNRGISPDFEQIRKTTMNFLQKRGFGVDVEANDCQPIKIAVKEGNGDVVKGLLLLGTYHSRNKTFLEQLSKTTRNSQVKKILNEFS